MRYFLSATDSTFSLVVKGLKVPTNNRTHRAVGKVVKKAKEYREFQRQINLVFKEHGDALKNFASDFNSKTHGLRCEYDLAIPGVVTQKGLLAKKKYDLFNYEKALTDSIITHFPNLDDSYILQGNIQKFNNLGNYFCFRYSLAVIERTPAWLQWPDALFKRLGDD